MDIKVTWKKGQRDAENHQLLPIPIPDSTPTVPVKALYHGVLDGDVVIVKDEEEINALSANGAFGHKVKAVPKPEKMSEEAKKGKLSNPFGAKCSETLSRRQYARRLGWIDADIGYGEGASGWQLRVDDCLVFDDTDDEDAGQREKTVRAERNHLPCQVTEVLLLVPEEAVFLAKELRCLEVKDRRGSVLSDRQLWTRFRGRDFNFLASYASYVHLRAKRWVVKPGLKFSVDWLLYQHGPAYTHASVAVKVVPVRLQKESHGSSRSREYRDRGRDREESFANVPFSELRDLVRLGTSVSKEIVILSVLIPEGTLCPTLLDDVKKIGVVSTFVQRPKLLKQV